MEKLDAMRSAFLIILRTAPLGAVCILFLSGCGHRTDRLPVRGKVTLNGQPLDGGSIRFASEGAAKVVVSGATIQNGEFQIPVEKGLPPATYHVEIYSPDTKAPPVSYASPPGGPKMPPTAPERIPAEYNVNSQKTVAVAADKDNHFDFDIASGRAK
jgi:hypothetical protein